MKWKQWGLDWKLLFEGSKNSISICNYTFGKKNLSVLIMFLETEILYIVVGTWRLLVADVLRRGTTYLN